MSKKIKKVEVLPDPIYNSVIISKLINYVMKEGRKSTARRIVYDAFGIIKEKTNREPMDVFESALQNARPLLEVKPKRIGGAVYQVPKEVPEGRGSVLVMRWILEAARKKKAKPMAEKLANEIMETANNSGEAIRKRDNVHKMAEANKSFAHLNR